MLKAGGGMLVSPSKDGKRPGYRFGDERDTRGFRERVDREVADRRASENRVAAATNIKSMQEALGTKGSISKKQQEARDRLRDQREGAQETIRQQREDAVIGRGPYKLEDKDLSFVERANRFGAQKFTNFRKNTLRNLIDYIASGRQFKYPVGSIYTDLTGKGLNLKPEEYLGLEGVSPARLSAMFGQDIIGTMDEEKIRDISKVLGQDVITQSEFEQFYPNMNVPDDKGGPDQQETDPCKGPNPPAYCFVNQPGDDPDDDDDNTQTGSGLALRFRKDGGRIGADKGGIMKASYGYDDAMAETFEEFLRLKKIKEIPADMEFDEYLDQLDIDVPYSRKDRGEQRIMAQEGGMMDSPVGGIMDLESARQMYGLGKLVKKATRAVKKITKSPLGKAAILAGLGIYGGGGFGVLKNKGFGALASNFFSKSNPLLFSNNKLSLGKLAALSAASPFLFQEDEEEDQTLDRGPSLDIARIRNNPYDFLGRAFVADGGIMRLGYQEGSKEPVAKKTMPLLDMGGKEMDLRDNGGFVPIGRMEKADDVPARLSKNEFVFTAEAVRNAGEGDVDKGAEVMYNMMKNLEAGGEVSEESQGLEGAREMFQTSKRLEEVL